MVLSNRPPTPSNSLEGETFGHFPLCYWKIANIAKNAKNASVLMGIGWFAKLDSDFFILNNSDCVAS